VGDKIDQGCWVSREYAEPSHNQSSDCGCGTRVRSLENIALALSSPENRQKSSREFAGRSRAQDSDCSGSTNARTLESKQLIQYADETELIPLENAQADVVPRAATVVAAPVPVAWSVSSSANALMKQSPLISRTRRPKPCSQQRL